MLFTVLGNKTEYDHLSQGKFTWGRMRTRMEGDGVGYIGSGVGMFEKFGGVVEQKSTKTLKVYTRNPVIMGK